MSQSRVCYLSFPNFSCHLPRGAATGAALGSSGSSSMVSCRVAMAWRLGSGICEDAEVVAGETRIRALDVFFWRREYVFSGVLRRADFEDDERGRLDGLGQLCICWRSMEACERLHRWSIALQQRD